MDKDNGRELSSVISMLELRETLGDEMECPAVIKYDMMEWSGVRRPWGHHLMHLNLL